MAAMSAANEAATICIGTQVLSAGHTDSSVVSKATAFMDERAKFKNIPSSFWDEIEAIVNMASAGKAAVKQQQQYDKGGSQREKNHHHEPQQNHTHSTSASFAQDPAPPQKMKQESLSSTAAPSSGRPKNMAMKRRRLA